MRLTWIDIRFRFWRWIALTAKSVLDTKKIERFIRSLEWKAMTAYGPVHVRAKKEAGCKSGCTIDFPHPGKDCFTHEDWDKLYKLTKQGYYIRRDSDDI